MNFLVPKNANFEGLRMSINCFGVFYYLKYIVLELIRKANEIQLNESDFGVEG